MEDTNNQEDGQSKAETSEKKDNSKETSEKEPAAEVNNDQVMGILSYLGILVIIPIAVAKDSEFAMYHANQGLVLFIAEVIIFAISLIPFLGWIIGFIGWIVAVVLAIMGIINAAQMKKKPLPIIGGIQILK